MKKNLSSQSGIFNPRILLAFVLCSFGVLLAMFSFGATPRSNTSLPADPANLLSTFGSNTNRLAPGVPLPPGSQFSPNEHGDPSSSSSTAGLPHPAGKPSRLDAGAAGMPLRPGTASA